MKQNTSMENEKIDSVMRMVFVYFDLAAEFRNEKSSCMAKRIL